jgi:TRAP-type C4-dicarboxylate transport system permease large subunit
MPPMRKYKYHDWLATGSIAAGGTLGSLIPPSVPMVIYGILTNSDIGKLFMAGILPGLLLVVLFIGSIAVLTALRPNVGPRGPRSDWRARLIALGRVRGILVLFTIVLGGIYFGIFTPTEAAGIVIELGLITPPIGMNVFVVKSVVKDVELWTIFAGVWPFVAAGLVALGLVIAFPEIALWLPSKM